MKISGFSLVFALFLAGELVSAQYFSAGWSPGQPVPQRSSEGWSPDQPVPPGIKTRPGSGSFDWTKLLTSGPVASLLNSAGINVTKSFAEAADKEANRWDNRIPLITDENYEDLIVNESLTEQEEKDRVWFLIITVARGQTGGLSEIVDSRFDSAYNETVVQDDLSNVRWGRIDYLDVTVLTTKWAIWQGPRLMVITDRGRTLRFFNPNNARSADMIRGWLRDELWRDYEPWSSSYAPGGNREWIMEYFALVLSKYHSGVSRIPKWLLLMLSGSAGSILLGLFHKNPPVQAQPRAAPAPPIAPSVAPTTTPKPQASPAPSKPKGGKLRKAKK